MSLLRLIFKGQSVRNSEFINPNFILLEDVPIPSHVSLSIDVTRPTPLLISKLPCFDKSFFQKFLSNLILSYFNFWSWQVLFDLFMNNWSNQTLSEVSNSNGLCSILLFLSLRLQLIVEYPFSLHFKEPKVPTSNSI